MDQLLGSSSFTKCSKKKWVFCNISGGFNREFHNNNNEFVYIYSNHESLRLLHVETRNKIPK